MMSNGVTRVEELGRDVTSARRSVYLAEVRFASAQNWAGTAVAFIVAMVALWASFTLFNMQRQSEDMATYGESLNRMAVVGQEIVSADAECSREESRNASRDKVTAGTFNDIEEDMAKGVLPTEAQLELLASPQLEVDSSSCEAFRAKAAEFQGFRQLVVGGPPETGLLSEGPWVLGGTLAAMLVVVMALKRSVTATGARLVEARSTLDGAAWRHEAELSQRSERATTISVSRARARTGRAPGAVRVAGRRE